MLSRRLSNDLFLNFILAGLVPLLVVGIVGYYMFTDMMQRDISRMQGELGDSIAGEIERFLDDPIRILSQIRSLVETQKNAPRSTIDAMLTTYTDEHPEILSIALLDRRGIVRHRVPLNQDYILIDMSGEPVFRKAQREGKPVWTPSSISLDTGQPSAALALPGDPTIIGFWDLISLKQIIERVRPGDRGFVAITDSEGTVIAHHQWEYVTQQMNYKNFAVIQEALGGKKNTKLQRMSGVDYLCSTSIVPGTRWVVLVAQPADDAFAPVSRMRMVFLVGMLFSAILGMVIAFYVSRRIVRPLMLLAGETRRVAAGDYETSLHHKEMMYDEIRNVSQDFEKMVAAVRIRELNVAVSEENLRTLFDSTQEAMIIHDFEGVILEVNRQMLALFGVSRAESLHKPLGRFLADDASQLEILLRAWTRTAESAPQLLECLARRTGSERTFWVEMLLQKIPWYGEQRVLAVIRDISERKAAQDALAAEKERLAATLRSLDEGVIAVNISGEAVLMNRAAELLTGVTLSSAAGKNISRVVPLVDETGAGRAEGIFGPALQQGIVDDIPRVLYLHDPAGTRHAVSCAVTPLRDAVSRVVGLVIVIRDITEQMRMERELLKSEKLESLGLLAGGIAHDFNNLLTSILGNISIAKLRLHDEEGLFERLDAAEKAAARASDLTQQLLTFSKGGAPVKRATSLKQIVQETALFALRGSNITCTVDLAPDLWRIHADAGQISQVINNLVINAMQAMPNGGNVVIHGENREISQATIEMPSGRYVYLSVSDQGGGIPEEIGGAVFDPYFTTKSNGSGLGLASVYSIVKKHEGFISFLSEPGKGTTFFFYLPATDEPADAGTERPGTPPLIGIRANVLLMDDEQDVREVAEQMIRALGCSVVSCRDGEEAFEAYKRERMGNTPFDVVIMDLTVPGGMGGKELIRKLLAYDPYTCAIVSSGYSNDPIMAFYRDFGFSGLISKPYTLAELERVLGEAIANSRRQPSG